MTRPSRIPRPVLLAATATAFSLFGDQTLYSVLPTAYKHLNLLPFQVGLLLSVNRWVRLLTNHYAERTIKRFGVTRPLVGSLTLGAGLTALYGMASPFAVLLAGRLLWGFCWSFIRQSGLMTATRCASDGNLGEVVGYYNGISRLGSIAGNALGALGHDRFGWTRTLLTFAVVSLFGVPLGAASQRHLPPSNLALSAPNHVRQSAAMAFSAFVLGCVGPGLVMSTLGLALKEKVGESVGVLDWTIGVATLNGLLLSTRWVLDGVGAPFLGALSDRIGRQRSAALFYGTGAVALAVGAGTGHAVVLAVSTLVFFLCATTLHVVVSAEASRRGSRNIAFFATADDAGSASGPLIGWTIRQVSLPTWTIFGLGSALYAMATFVGRAAFCDNGRR